MSTDHPKRIGGYDVLGRIGKGGMGAVFKAVQPSLNRMVAIKVLGDGLDDETSVERFKREAKAVAMLNHPNVVQIIEMDSHNGQPYFVMEYVKGTSLDAIMERRRLSMTEALAVFKEVCRGLQAAHRQNIVHRDLNPRNVLVSEDLAEVKLADFGISRVDSISRSQGTLSTGNVTMGTLHYIAPEQTADMAEVDHRADIYSLGVLLYEMLTGRVPVGRFSLPSQLEEGVPPEIDPLVLRCLNADPSDRFPSVDRVLEAVNKLEDELRLSFAQDFTGLSKSTTRLLSRSTKSLRGKALMGAAAVLGVLAIGMTAFWMMRPSAPETASKPVGNEILAQETERFSAEEAGQGVVLAGAEVPLPEGEQEPEVEEPEPEAVVAKATSAPKRTPTTTKPEASPTGPSAEEMLAAALKTAEAGLTDQALSQLNAIINGSNQTQAAAALLERAKIQTKVGKADDAMASLIEMETRFPRAAGLTEARYTLGYLLQQKGKKSFPAARDAYSSAVKGGGSSTYVPLALEQRAEIEDELKLSETDSALGRRVSASLISRRMLAERFPSHRSAEKAGWELAQAYRSLDLYAEAAEAFARVGRYFPKTRLDAWWEAGELYEERVKDVPKALDAYGKVPETSRRYDNAQRRIRKLS